jgi:alcohol dehydrogenase class IV
MRKINGLFWRKAVVLRYLNAMRFEFATSTRIVFGRGKAVEAVAAAALMGTHVLLVCGNSFSQLDSFMAGFQDNNLACTRLLISAEPTIPWVLEAVRMARGSGCDVVIGCGGGSALDAAKAIAALMANPGDPLDYLEVVGNGNSLTKPCAPCICIPTTAGTGSEVTRNAVLISPGHQVKVSLRSPKMLPLLAIVDPDLTRSMSPAVTASTGIDALTQLIEPFVCIAANPLIDSICREGLRAAARGLRPAYADGNNMQAREDMAMASLFGGLALANAGLGAVHGIAAPLGGTVSIPHGTVCARLLPIVMDSNLKALRSRGRDSDALSRYSEVARLLTGNPSAAAEDGIEWAFALCTDLSIPRLSAFGLTPRHLPDIVRKAQQSSSMRGNPIQLTTDELTNILEQSL